MKMKISNLLFKTATAGNIWQQKFQFFLIKKIYILEFCFWKIEWFL